MWRRERPRLVPRTPRTTCNDSDHGQLHTLHDRTARRSGAAEATGPEGTTTALGREGALSVPQGSPERVAAGSGTERSGVSASPRPSPHGPGRGSQHRSHVGLRRRGGSDGTAQLRTQLRRVTLQAGPQATTRLRSADLAGDASRPPPKLAHSQALPSSRGGYSGDLGPPRTHAPQPCSRACIPARRPRSPASPRHLHQDLPLGPRPRHGRPR